MTTGLKQLQIRYEPEQDRLLLAASTQDRCEYRIWITRRMAALVLDGLDRHLKTGGEAQPAAPAPAAPEGGRPAPSPTAPSASTPARTAELQAFREDAALSKADFDTPFEGDAETYPLGTGGVLAYRLQLGHLADGRHRLTLLPKTGQGVDLSLQEAQLFGFRKLLVDGIAKAEWRLPIGRRPLTVPEGATIN